MCKNVVSRNQLKIKCEECSGNFHANCVHKSKADLEYINSENQLWRCPPCTKERRQSMAIESEAEEHGKADISTVVAIHKEAKEDRRRVERDLGASLELCHSKIDDNLNMMEEQDKKFENCLKIIDLTSENLYST